jgi:hypothetical protein
VDAVRADQQIRVQCLAVGEMYGDVGSGLGISGHVGVGADSVAADGVGQEVVQLGARHEEELVIAVGVPGSADRIAGRVEEPRVLFDAHVADGRADAEVVEFSQRVGPQADTGADGSDLWCLFQHDDLVADEFEGGRGCEPYQAAADDHRGFRGQRLYSFG